MRAIRQHLTYANVMSSFAVFMVLGGTAYAAVKLPRNSVGTQHIKDRGVRSNDLARGSVGSGAIKDGSLTLRDFKTGEVAGGGAAGAGGAGGADGQGGAAGPAGPQGPEGPAGPGAAAGRDGAALVTTFRNASALTPPSGSTDQHGQQLAMTGGAWTQPANTLNWFFARVNVSYGTQCRDAGEGLRVSLRLGNQVLTQPTYVDFSYPGQGSSHWFAIPFDVEDSWLIPPATDTARQLVAYAYSTCGQQPTTPIKVEELRVDVVQAAR